MKKRYQLLFPLLLLHAPSILAQSSEEEELALSYGDNASVSIATGNEQALRRAPSVASVITSEDITIMGAKDLDEVMETVPGVHVSRTANYYSPTYVIRGIFGGAANPQVLMLQNGIPMNTLYVGDKGLYWGGLSLENVARIEIIRGPGSALYGADAYSGVINIITKTAAQTPGTEFGVRAGSFNSENAWVQHGGQWGPFDVAAYLNVGTTAGQKQIIAADAQTARDLRFGTKASLAPGPVNTGYDSVDAGLDLSHDKWRLRGGYKLRNNLGTGAGVASALDPIGLNRSERITGDLSWNDANLSEHWGAGFSGSYLYYAETLNQNYQLSPPGSTFATGSFPNGLIGDPGRREQQLRASGFATYNGWSGHNMRVGIGHDDLDMYQTSTFKNYLLTAAGPVPSAFIDYYSTQSHLLPHQRRINYLYAQDEWNFARDWTLTAGVRDDRYSDFGNTTNPRLALVWDATYDLTAKLLYGRAFRAPSFNEQYGINPVANGNPNLTPETIDTMETAFSWQARSDTQLNLNLFRYNMANTIRLVANPAGAAYQNTGSQHGSGIEVEASWDATRALRLSGNYSYQKSIDDATNQDSGYAPRQHFYLRGDWRFSGNWLTSVQINRVMDRKRAAGDIRPQVPDYTTCDLNLHTNADKSRWEYGASVRNLFNAYALEPSLGGAAGSQIPNDLPLAPRSFWLQLIYKP